MTLMVSREREYLADASSAQFTRNPEALAKALEKIAEADAPTLLVRPASAALCIASPAAADLAGEESWFATHPPIRKRIERLRSIGRAS
jgi:heat shock protein HtpX